MSIIKVIATNVLVLVLSVFSMSAFSQTGSADGTIQNIFMYGNGMALITGFSFSSATCTNNCGFYIEGNHPQFSRLLAALLAARAAGSSISVVAKIDNCWYPHLTDDASTYFVVHP